MKYRDLTIKQRRRVVKNIRFAFAAAGYDVVSGPDQLLRPRGTVEYGGEDSALPVWNRLRMINMARQGVRNGDSLRALMRQMELNVVGTVGGKATFTFPDGFAGAADEIRDAFAKWARHAEFSDGLPFSKVLALVVDTKFTGGDMVLLFDDGLIEDSGRLLAFDPDEIGDVPKDWLAERLPGTTQRQGRIYNRFGRFIGVTVSRKYRGCGSFKRDPEGVLFLTMDDFADDSDWVMLREVWRFNQGRGVPPVAAPLDSLLDLESVTKFEVQAAMKNCQTLGQVIATSDNAANGDADDEDDELDPELARKAAAAAGNGGEEGEGAEGETDAVSDAAEPPDEDVTLDNIRGAGAIFDQLPDGYKMELLDTKRPNPNVEGFVKWLSGRSGAAVGLAKCYANMEATTSYTAFRGEQVMTWPTFEEWQKSLEREVCDWVVRRWARWATRKGLLKVTLPDGWERFVAWSWPTMREVDQKKAAEAKKVMLESGLILLDELHPGDKRGFMRKLGEDIQLYHEIGLQHPIEKVASGAGAAPVNEPKDEEGEE